jgi:hypothetical protein
VVVQEPRPLPYFDFCSESSFDQQQMGEIRDFKGIFYESGADLESSPLPAFHEPGLVAPPYFKKRREVQFDCVPRRKSKGAGSMIQVVECLSRKYKVLSSNPSSVKKKRKQGFDRVLYHMPLSRLHFITVLSSGVHLIVSVAFHTIVFFMISFYLLFLFLFLSMIFPYFL